MPGLRSHVILGIVRTYKYLNPRHSFVNEKPSLWLVKDCC